jgi:hypothetical protein
MMGMAAAGCGSGGSTSGEPTERQVLQAQWEEMWTVGGVEDTTLIQPFRFTASPTGIYVIDRAMQVAAFDPGSGELLWAVGEEGGGPGQFRSLDGITALPDGSALVLDVRNGRMTVFDRTGVETEALATDGGPMAPISACPTPRGYLVLGVDPEDVLVEVDDRFQEVIGRPRSPWRHLEGEPFLVRQGVLLPTDDGACVYVLEVGEGYGIYRDGELQSTGRYVEPVPPPAYETYQTEPGVPPSVRLAGEVVPGVLGAQVFGDTLFVGFGGATELARRVIDVYDWREGRYLHSLVIPGLFDRITLAGGTFVFLYHTPQGYPAMMGARVFAGGTTASD